MNFLEAVKAMKEGKKVKLPHWKEGSCWRMTGEHLRDSKDDLVENWQIVEEKKTLSDKAIGFDTYENESNREYKEKDVKEAIKEFIEWIKSEEAYDAEPFDKKCVEKTKEIFGERLT